MFRYVLVITVLVLLSVSVTGQTPWQPPRTPDGQPDMQGVWRSNFFPALSLEGDHSSWGLEVDNLLQGSNFQPPPSIIVDPADGKIPYQPWALEKRKVFIENYRAPTKREHIDPTTRSLLLGVPRVNHMPPSRRGPVAAVGCPLAVSAVSGCVPV